MSEDDEVRRNVRDWTVDERQEFLKERDEAQAEKPRGLKFRDARNPALKHATEQLKLLKADPQASAYDVRCARDRCEIAAVDPRRYWDAWNDWSDWRKTSIPPAAQV
jgi:hypothetical protein